MILSSSWWGIDYAYQISGDGSKYLSLLKSMCKQEVVCIRYLGMDWYVCNIPLLARALGLKDMIGYYRATIGYGAVYKGRPANGEGGSFWNFGNSRTGGGGWFVKVRTSEHFWKNRNFSKLFKVKTRNYNRSRFQYESLHIWRLQQPERQQISLIKNRSLKQGSIVRGQLSGVKSKCYLNLFWL